MCCRHIWGPGFGPFKQALGAAKVSLGSITAFANNREAVEQATALPSVELYVEKRKMKMLPPNVKLRREIHPYVCKVRAKLWMTKLEQEIAEKEQDSEDIILSPDETDDEEEDLNVSNLVPVTLPEVYEWDIADVTFPLSIHKLNRLMFSHDSMFAGVFFRAKGYSEINVEPWSDDGKREVKYLIPKSGMLKANHATEAQEYVVKGNGAYVVHVTSSTPEVMYGSTFKVQLQFCLVPDGPTGRNSRLKITAEMHWLSSPFMKRVIAQGAKSGVTACYELYTRELHKCIAARRTQSATTSNAVAHATDQGSTPLNDAESSLNYSAPNRAREGAREGASSRTPSAMQRRGILVGMGSPGFFSLLAFVVLIALNMLLLWYVAELSSQVVQLRMVVQSHDGSSCTTSNPYSAKQT